MTKLKKYSPYSTGTIIKHDDGTEELEAGEFTIEKSTKDRYVQVTGNNTLCSESYKVYNEDITDSGKYYWIVASANEIDNPLDSSELEGKKLLFPDILKFGILN